MNTKILDLMLENRDWLSLERSMRLYANLCEVMDKMIDGDVVEMGSHHGGSAMLIAATMGDMYYHAEFHIFDSFKGFPTPSNKDSTLYHGGEFAVEGQILVGNFIKHQLTIPVIHKGFFKETAAQMPKQICFAHLDSDLYSSILESLQIVWPRLSPGGVIVVDDYGHEKFPGVRTAIEEYFKGDAIVMSEHIEQAVIRK